MRGTGVDTKGREAIREADKVGKKAHKRSGRV